MTFSNTYKSEMRGPREAYVRGCWIAKRDTLIWEEIRAVERHEGSGGPGHAKQMLYFDPLWFSFRVEGLGRTV